jgi:CheY-like chemotaxis protein
MDGYGKRILVVDDDAACRALVEAQLEQEGYAVHTACDGVAGLDALQQRRFAAVITDGHMPGLHGLELVRFCKIAWPDTPVILLSGDLNEVTDCDNDVAAAACLRKPYEAAMLLRTLRTVTHQASRV